MRFADKAGVALSGFGATNTWACAVFREACVNRNKIKNLVRFWRIAAVF